MIIVCNTSPLTNLAAIDQFQLLKDVFGQINIPSQVANELSWGGTSWPGAAEVAMADWVEAK